MSNITHEPDLSLTWTVAILCNRWTSRTDSNPAAWLQHLLSITTISQIQQVFWYQSLRPFYRPFWKKRQFTILHFDTTAKTTSLALI